MVEPPVGAPLFQVHLAPDMMGGIKTELHALRFHLSAADAQVMLGWPSVSRIALAPPLRRLYADSVEVLRAVVKAGTFGRSHVLLGQWILAKLPGGYLYTQHGLCSSPMDALRLGDKVWCLGQSRLTLLRSTSGSQENMDDWVDEDHDADTVDFDPDWELRLFQDS